MEEANNKKIQSGNKMGTMPIRRLLITMSLPIMISMLVQALYNIVDSYYVSQLSQDALSAVTLAFPMQNLMIAVAAGTGVGINALLSKSLGERNFEKANDAACNGIALAIISSLAFVLVGLFLVRPFVYLQTGTQQIRDYSIIYTSIVCCVSIGIFMQITLERLLQSTGMTHLSMISQMTGAVINIILDPIMIFGLLGFPRLGIAGAAIATVAGQCCASMLGLFLNIRYNKEISISPDRIVHLKADTVKSIYAVGIPSAMMMSIGSVMTFFMNKLLGTFSDTATAVFGAYFKLQSFFFMPVIGINNGSVPIIAYNYGAKNKQRIREAIISALMLAFCVMLIGTVIFEAMPEKLMSIFNASEEMLTMGVPALRIIAIHFPIAACCIILIAAFQGFSKGEYALVSSVCRQLVVLLPVAWLLSLTGNVRNIWWAFPVAEVACLLVSVALFLKLYRNVDV